MDKFFYLLQVVDGLRIILIVILIVSAVIAFVGVINKLTECVNDEKANKKILLWALSIVAATSILLVFIPSKKTILCMTGGRIAEEFVENNEKVKEIPGKTVELIYNELERLTSKGKGEE